MLDRAHLLRLSGANQFFVLRLSNGNKSVMVRLACRRILYFCFDFLCARRPVTCIINQPDARRTTFDSNGNRIEYENDETIEIIR